MAKVERIGEGILMLCGAAYLGVGVILTAFPVLTLLVALFSPAAAVGQLFTEGALAFWGYRIVAIAPCFVIAYALLRRRNWGRYLLISYNLWWMGLLTYRLLSASSQGRSSMTIAVWALVVAVYLVLGGLICLVLSTNMKFSNSTQTA